MVISRVELRRGGRRSDLTWAGLIEVGRAWEETKAAKAEMMKARENSMLLILFVDVRKVGLLL